MRMVTPEMILARLPAYQDKWVLIKEEQFVPDIIKEITAAHKMYGWHYDRFSDLFYSKNPDTVTRRLNEFCRDFIRYKEEPKEEQTSELPAGILIRGYGDCKHYALFTAGVIGSLNRLYNCCFDADFLFVGYDGAKEPYHVFVRVVESRDMEIWVDPTPGSGGTPSLVVAKPV